MPLSSTSSGPQSPPQRGWPAPQLLGGGERSRPLPLTAREGRVQQIGLPRGGLPRVRPFPSLLEKPPTGEGIEWGPPASFLLKAAPGREEGSLSYKWGGY